MCAARQLHPSAAPRGSLRRRFTCQSSWKIAVKTPLKIGGATPGSSTDDVPNVLHAALGLPLQVVKDTRARRISASPPRAAKWRVSAPAGNRLNQSGASRSIQATPSSPFKPYPSPIRTCPKFRWRSATRSRKKQKNSFRSARTIPGHGRARSSCRREHRRTEFNSCARLSLIR